MDGTAPSSSARLRPGKGSRGVYLGTGWKRHREWRRKRGHGASAGRVVDASRPDDGAWSAGPTRASAVICRLAVHGAALRSAARADRSEGALETERARSEPQYIRVVGGPGRGRRRPRWTRGPVRSWRPKAEGKEDEAPSRRR
ncbi:hypothetical protein THAOC_28550, partial [Thalassiosira oceanica]